MGDLLYRSKLIVEHIGVYLGNGQVLHNHPSGGVIITPYEEFSDGKTVKVTLVPEVSLGLLEKRIREILRQDEKYKLFGNNCEHIANFLIGGRKYSPQIQSAIAGVLVTAVIGRNMKGLNWLALLLLGGLVGLISCNTSRNYDQIIYAD
jgi:lecithin:retinol acyltransferase